MVCVAFEAVSLHPSGDHFPPSLPWLQSLETLLKWYHKLLGQDCGIFVGSSIQIKDSGFTVLYPCVAIVLRGRKRGIEGVDAREEGGSREGLRSAREEK